MSLQQLRNHVQVILDSKLDRNVKQLALEQLKEYYKEFTSEWMYLTAKLNELYVEQ